MAIYDKAKWHYEGDFPKDLARYQGYVHIGLFLGWAIDRGFEGALLREDFAEELASYRAKKITATRLLQITDGVLDDQLLSEEGCHFARAYYEAQYHSDYAALFPEAQTSYHVEDTPSNAQLVARKVDTRYNAWKANRK